MKLISTLAAKSDSADTILRSSYLMADSCIIKNSKPFFLPETGTPYSATAALAVCVGKLGKTIASRFAYRYFHSIAPAIVFRAEGLLSELRDAALPCSSALSFDGAASLGTDIDRAVMNSILAEAEKELFGKDIQSELHTDKPAEVFSHITFSIGDSISDIPTDTPVFDKIFRWIAGFSQLNTLRNGDTFLFPLDTISTSLDTNQRIEARTTGNTLLHFNIK